MKTITSQIKRLVEISKKYSNLGINLGFPDGHHNLGIANVYYANNYETTSVSFDYSKIEVSFYSNKISLPININLNMISKLCDLAEIDFNEMTKDSKYKDEAKNKRIESINKMKEEIRRLESIGTE